jgi:hypothetical protein
MMSRVGLSKDSIEEKMTGVFDLELNEGSSHINDFGDEDDDAIEVDQVRGVSRFVGGLKSWADLRGTNL